MQIARPGSAYLNRVARAMVQVADRAGSEHRCGGASDRTRTVASSAHGDGSCRQVRFRDHNFPQHGIDAARFADWVERHLRVCQARVYRRRQRTRSDFVWHAKMQAQRHGHSAARASTARTAPRFCILGRSEIWTKCGESLDLDAQV